MWYGRQIGDTGIENCFFQHVTGWDEVIRQNCIHIQDGGASASTSKGETSSPRFRLFFATLSI
ncbi:MAG: hypothetical protein WD097_07840 [Balneolales bacterium]